MMCIKFIKTAISAIFIFSIIIIFSVITLPMVLLPARLRYKNKLYYLLLTISAKLIVFFSFIKVKILNKQNLSLIKKSPVIIISNHASSLDIPLIEMLFGTLPRFWLIKSGYKHIPIFGFILDRMNVWVKKQSVFKTKETFKNATLLAQKTSQHIIIFPEGRRYSDGQIHQFYNGFFNLAEQLNRPVLPIAIHGLYKILPKKSFLIDSNACLVKISIGKIMYISDYKTKQDFIETAQNWFKQQLNDLEKK